MITVEAVRFLLSASRSLDFTYAGLLDHHQRVAYLSLVLGQAAGIHREELYRLFKTAIIHDAGVATFKEKERLLEFEVEPEARWEHCRKGFEFAAEVRALDSCAHNLLVHHDRWAGGNPSGFEQSGIPLIGRIVHLADRVDVLIQDEIPILQQASSIKRRIQSKAGQEFDPELVHLLLGLLERESLWLDLTAPWLEERLLACLMAITLPGRVDLMDLGQLFARVVDAKSRFTYCHSRGVAACARILGDELGFSSSECDLLEAAGLLHDLGKVTVPEDILEKNSSLTGAEFNLVKQHPYYTYWLLKSVTRELSLAEWAAFHHERLDGSGYPFQKTAAELALGARIVAVADVFTALREERPYRSGLAWPEIQRILTEQAQAKALDARVVETLLSSRSRLDAKWEQLKNNRPCVPGPT